MKVTLRLRLSAHDAHYGGGLVDGARVLGLFGDVATELLIRHDGDEGLFRAYDSVEFLAPLRVGDFIDATARVVERGKTSRKIALELHKVASVGADGRGTHHDPPVLAARASVTIVVGRGVGAE